MSTSLKALIVSATFLVPVISPLSPHYAQAYSYSSSGAVVCENMDDVINDKGLKCLEGVTDSIFKGIIALIIIGMFIMMLMGGMRYVTAGGDQKAIDSARKTITYAVTGVVFALAGYYLLNVLGNTVGLANLLRFELPQPTF